MKHIRSNLIHFSVTLHTATGLVSLYDGRNSDAAYEAHSKLLRILQSTGGTGSVYFNRLGELTVTHIANGQELR